MANDSYWNDLAGLYASINAPNQASQASQTQTNSGMTAGFPGAQSGQTDGSSPAATMAGQPGQAGQAVQGYQYGGLVDDLGPAQTPMGGGGSDSPWWMTALKGFTGQVAPAAASAATGMLIDRMFPGTPGKTRAVDLRQPEMQRGAVMAEERLKNLQANPTSFGLPGDPNDINTPAGKRLYQMRKNRRSADAASGRLETGGSALRETEDINAAIGNEYNQVMNSGFSNLSAMTPQLQTQTEPGRANPWSSILTKALAPGVGAGVQAAIPKSWYI